MSVLWSVGGFFLILTPIILVHEYGHFIAARLRNIRVEEFGLGFPPRAVTLFKRKGTLFTINWIPLGGFVRPAGEDDPNVPGGLASASKMSRFIVLVSGAIANFILALILFWIMFMLGQPEVNENQIAISGIQPDSPAAVAGMEPGDIFLQVNGIAVEGDFETLINETQATAGQTMSVLLLRDGSEIPLEIVPRLPEEYDPSREGALGISIENPETGNVLYMNPIEALGNSFYTIFDIIAQTVLVPARLISGELQQGEARLMSVVAISQVAGQATQRTVEEQQIGYVLWISGAISVALGFTNLLPLPALDGGRILFVLIEAVRGRRIEPEREGMVHVMGMMVLLGLMVLLIVRDIIDPIVLPS